MFKRKNRTIILTEEKVEFDGGDILRIGDLRDFVEATKDWPERWPVAEAFQGSFGGELQARRMVESKPSGPA